MKNLSKTLNRYLKCILLFFTLFLKFGSSLVLAQVNIKFNEAMENESIANLDKIIKNTETFKIKVSSNKLNILLSNIFKKYCADTSYGQLLLDKITSKTIYIPLQPEVNVAHVNLLSLSQIKTDYKSETTALFKPIFSLSHKELFYGDYYDLEEKPKSITFKTINQLDNSGRYKPVIVDTGFIEQVNSFLEIKKNGSLKSYLIHNDKADFLKNRLRLNQSYTKGKKMPNGDYYSTYYFSYPYYIDRIVIDREEKNAFVQFTTRFTREEAFYTFLDNQWILVDAWPRLVR